MNRRNFVKSVPAIAAAPLVKNPPPNETTIELALTVPVWLPKFIHGQIVVFAEVLGKDVTKEVQEAVRAGKDLIYVKLEDGMVIEESTQFRVRFIDEKVGL